MPSPFDHLFAPQNPVGAQPAMAPPQFGAPMSAAPAPMPAPAPQMPQLPPQVQQATASPNFLGMVMPVLASMMASRKDPVAFGQGLAAWQRGANAKREERESIQEREDRKLRERAEFYSRAVQDASQIQDPIQFEQWKAAIAPFAEQHQIPAEVFVFSDAKRQERDRKLVAEAMAKVRAAYDDEQADEIINSDSYTLQLSDGRSITMREARSMTGGIVSAAGKPVPRNKKNPFTGVSPDEMKIAAFAKAQGVPVEDLTPEQIQTAVSAGKPVSTPNEPKKTLEEQLLAAIQSGDKATEQQIRSVLNARDVNMGGGGSSATSELVQAVLDNPELYDRLTATQIAKIAPDLNKAGFKGFGKTMNESAIVKIAETKSAIASLRDLRQTLQANEQYIGPIAGLQALNPYSEARQAQAKIDLVKQRVGKALEGGVLRKEDEEKYKKILATLRDEPTTAIYKVDSLIQTLERDMETFVEQQRTAGRRVPEGGGGVRVISIEEVTK